MSDLDKLMVTNNSNDLGFSHSEKLGKVIDAYSLGRAIWQTFKALHEFVQGNRRLSITITSKDPLYIPVLSWLSNENFGKQAKQTALVSRAGRSDFEELADTDSTPSSLKVVHNAHTTQKLHVRGHKVSVRIIDPETQENSKSMSTVSKVEFTMYKAEAYDAVLAEIFELHEAYKAGLRPPRLYTPSGWGGFGSNDSLPPRTMDSVILKDGEVDFLLQDLTTFLSSEDRYNKLGLPWHRGYLFYGAVGTGKTSIAKALANHFGLDVYLLPLGDMKDDSNLAKFLSDLSPRSVLLLEDIDVFSAATSREAEKNEASLSGLLNALDGVATPHGMITIMTTNEIERLDDALIRPGRVDVRQEFTNLSQDQGVKLFEHFYGIKPTNLSFDGLAPSTVIGVFKQHLDDPKAARRALQGRGVVIR